jgi:hypothetical protein
MSAGFIHVWVVVFIVSRHGSLSCWSNGCFYCCFTVTVDVGPPTLRQAWTTRTPRRVLGRQLAQQLKNKQGSEGNWCLIGLNTSRFCLIGYKIAGCHHYRRLITIYQCTLMPTHQCSSMSVHQRTLMPTHQCPSMPTHHCTLMPTH